jgi:MSHA biogenesis protein MshJ
LTLLKLESLPATTLPEAKEQPQPSYKHGLVITCAGTYADTVRYLESLEALQWAIIWESLDYKVKEYPMAEITIRVVTLSFDKGWLGV